MRLPSLTESLQNNWGIYSLVCEICSVHCIQGRYPQSLLDLWDDYDDAKQSQNDRPGMSLFSQTTSTTAVSKLLTFKINFRNLIGLEIVANDYCWVRRPTVTEAVDGCTPPLTTIGCCRQSLTAFSSRRRLLTAESRLTTVVEDWRRLSTVDCRQPRWEWAIITIRVCPVKPTKFLMF